MHRFLGFPRPPHGRTHRFLAVGMTVTCRLHEAELRPSTSLRHGGAGRRRASTLCTSSPRPRPTWPPCEMPWRRRTRRWHGRSRRRPTWSTVKCECCAGALRWGGFWGVGGACLCVCDCPFLRGVCAGAVGVRTVSYPKSEKIHARLLNVTVS